MPKTKKQTIIKIKLTKAAEAAIKKEAEAFEGLTFAKQAKAFKTACNAAEHSPEVALIVALGRIVTFQFDELSKLHKQLLDRLKNK